MWIEMRIEMSNPTLDAACLFFLNLFRIPLTIENIYPSHSVFYIDSDDRAITFQQLFKPKPNPC